MTAEDGRGGGSRKAEGRWGSGDGALIRVGGKESGQHMANGADWLMLNAKEDLLVGDSEDLGERGFWGSMLPSVYAA